MTSRNPSFLTRHLLLSAGIVSLLAATSVVQAEPIVAQPVDVGPLSTGPVDLPYGETAAASGGVDSAPAVGIEPFGPVSILGGSACNGACLVPYADLETSGGVALVAEGFLVLTPGAAWSCSLGTDAQPLCHADAEGILLN